MGVVLWGQDALRADVCGVAVVAVVQSGLVVGFAQGLLGVRVFLWGSGFGWSAGLLLPVPLAIPPLRSLPEIPNSILIQFRLHQTDLTSKRIDSPIECIDFGGTVDA